MLPMQLVPTLHLLSRLQCRPRTGGLPLGLSISHAGLTKEAAAGAGKTARIQTTSQQASQIRQQQAHARLQAIGMIECLPIKCLEAFCDNNYWLLKKRALALQIRCRRHRIGQARKSAASGLTRPPGSYGHPSGAAAEAAAGTHPVKEAACQKDNILQPFADAQSKQENSTDLSSPA